MLLCDWWISVNAYPHVYDVNLGVANITTCEKGEAAMWAGDGNDVGDVGEGRTHSSVIFQCIPGKRSFRTVAWSECPTGECSILEMSDPSSPVQQRSGSKCMTFFAQQGLGERRLQSKLDIPSLWPRS